MGCGLVTSPEGNQAPEPRGGLRFAVAARRQVRNPDRVAAGPLVISRARGTAAEQAAEAAALRLVGGRLVALQQHGLVVSSQCGHLSNLGLLGSVEGCFRHADDLRPHPNGPFAMADSPYWSS